MLGVARTRVGFVSAIMNLGMDKLLLEHSSGLSSRITILVMPHLSHSISMMEVTNKSILVAPSILGKPMIIPLAIPIGDPAYIREGTAELSTDILLFRLPHRRLTITQLLTTLNLLTKMGFLILTASFLAQQERT